METIMTTSNEFATWVATQIQELGWSDSELARRAGMSPSAVSRVISGERGVTCEWTIAVSQALGADPVWGLRRADLLPSPPPSVQEEQEAVNILRSLPVPVRSSALLMLRGLVGPGVARPFCETGPTSRQLPEPRQPETIQVGQDLKTMLSLIYRHHNQPAPDGPDIEITAALVEMLLDELRQVEQSLKTIWRLFFEVTPPALRGELRRLVQQEQQEQHDSSSQR